MTMIVDTTSEDLLAGISQSLQELSEQTPNFNFRAAPERKIFLDATLAIKAKYCLLESMLTGNTEVKVESPVLKLHLNHPIQNKQMEGWLKKLVANVLNYRALPPDELEDKLNFVSIQQKLLDTVVKVVNGDARFIGVPRIL